MHAARMIAEATARQAEALERAAKARAEGEHELARYETSLADREQTVIARWTRIKANVDTAPPLTAAQRDRLRLLLRPSTQTTPAPAKTAPTGALTPAEA